MRNHDSGFAALHPASPQRSAVFRRPEGESEGELVTQIVGKMTIQPLLNWVAFGADIGLEHPSAPRNPSSKNWIPLQLELKNGIS